jgi:hypothetical protein
MQSCKSYRETVRRHVLEIDAGKLEDQEDFLGISAYVETLCVKWHMTVFYLGQTQLVGNY